MRLLHLTLRTLVLGIVLFVVACAPSTPAQPTPTRPAATAPPAVASSPAAAPATAKPSASPQPAGQAASAGPTANPAAKKGGTLTFGVSKDIVNPNPFINTQSVGQYMKETMYEALLAYDLDGNLLPALAESWDVSPDARQFTFKLRRGVKFHNGRELKADDVVWSAKHVQDPENGAIGQTFMTTVQSVQKVDDYTVRYTTKSPSVPFLGSMALIGVVPIVPAESVQPRQLDVGQKPPPGTGPFKFVEYEANTQTVVDRFDDYWGGAPFLDRVIMKVLPNDTVRFNALRSGDLDIGERAPVESAPRVESGEIRGIRLAQAKNSGMRAFAFNMQSAVFKDVRMRQAGLLAIDRDRVIEELWGKYGTPVEIQMPVNSIWQKTAAAMATPRKGDPARARQLMQEARYTGQELSLVGRRGHEQLAESLERQLSAVGMRIKVEILETAVNEERQAKGLFDIILGGGSLDEDPVISLKADYACETGDRRVDNEAGYCNPAVDKLFDALESETNDQKRLDVYKQLVDLLFKEHVWVYLGTEPRFFGMADKVQDFKPTDGGSYVSRFEGLKKTWLR